MRTALHSTACCILCRATSHAHARARACASLICLLWVLSDRQVNVDVGIALTVFFALIDSGDLVSILAILVVIVVPSVVGMTFLVKIVQDRRTVLFNLDNVLVADGQKFNDLSEYSATICIYQAGDNFIRDVASRSPQHLFEL